MSVRVDRLRLERALASLDERRRRLFLMSAVEGLDHDEIASRLGISVEAVERYLAEALVRLDKDIERMERPWWRFWR